MSAQILPFRRNCTSDPFSFAEMRVAADFQDLVDSMGTRLFPGLGREQTEARVHLMILKINRRIDELQAKSA